MSNTSHIILIVAVVAAITFFTRAVPFIIFGGKRAMPERVKIMADMLPYAIIATLVIYCLKGLDFSAFSTGAAQIIAVAAVALLHIWKHNTLLSIACGTILYMILIRVM